MDTEELAAGLEDIAAQQAVAEAVAGAPEGEAASWSPSIDWLMGSVGPFFNNNQGIGELLLGKLMESGVNTEGVALAGLVNCLQQFSQEYKALGEAIGSNLDRINELSDQNENLAQSIQDVIKEMGVSKDEGGAAPAEEGAMADMPMPEAPDAGGGAPPMDMGAGGAGAMEAAPPADMGAGDAGAAPDMGAGGAGGAGDAPMPDAGAGGAGAVPPMDAAATVSDAGMKEPARRKLSLDEYRQVISDARMKRLERYEAKHPAKEKKSGGLSISSSIIDACKDGGL